MKPVCAGCKYDLSATPGSFAAGWRCPECGLVNQAAEVGWSSRSGGSGELGPFLLRAAAIVGLWVLNVFVIGLLVWQMRLPGFSPWFGIAGLLVLIEAVAWQFAIRSRYFRGLPALRCLVVSSVLAAGTLFALVAAFVLLLFTSGGMV